MYAEAVASYQDGAHDDWPATTWRAVGSRHAWYVATCLDRPGLDNLAGVLVAQTGVGPDLAALAGVEVARRWSDAASPAGQEPTSWVFVLNHGAAVHYNGGRRGGLTLTAQNSGSSGHDHCQGWEHSPCMPLTVTRM